MDTNDINAALNPLRAWVGRNAWKAFLGALGVGFAAGALIF